MEADGHAMETDMVQQPAVVMPYSEKKQKLSAGTILSLAVVVPLGRYQGRNHLIFKFNFQMFPNWWP